MKAFPTKRLKKLSYFPFCFEEDTYTNPSANAGDTSSIPSPGRAHMPRSPGSRATVTTTEAHVLQLPKPLRLEPVHHNKRSHLKEKPMHTINSSSHSPQLGKTLAKHRKLSTAGNT